VESEKIKIEVNVSEATRQFMFHIKETTECLTHIYFAIEKSDYDVNHPLPTDSLPITINDYKPKPTLEEQKIITLNWVMQHVFEDFINGLMKSFKAAYKYLKIYALSKEPPMTKSRGQIEEYLQQIEIDIEKLHFPDFIGKIESLLGRELPFKEEIKSVNQIRNCLVHRHGIVGEKDIKGLSQKSLRLKWVSLETTTMKDGQEKSLSFDVRKEGIVVDNLVLKHVEKEKAFQLGEKISLNINEFNGVTFTCTTFANLLYLLMPVSPDFVSK
jgi:hypothetical protein